MPIFLKLYTCFCHGLKMCMWFGYILRLILNIHFCGVNTIKVYVYWVPCVCNYSNSFMPIFFKLYRCFCHGLKICMWFGYNPQIIFFSLLIVHISLTHYKAGDINSLNFSPCFFFQVFIFASSFAVRIQGCRRVFRYPLSGGGYRCQCSGTCLIASFVFYMIVLIMTGKCL